MDCWLGRYCLCVLGPGCCGAHRKKGGVYGKSRRPQRQGYACVCMCARFRCMRVCSFLHAHVDAIMRICMLPCFWEIVAAWPETLHVAMQWLPELGFTPRPVLPPALPTAKTLPPLTSLPRLDDKSCLPRGPQCTAVPAPRLSSQLLPPLSANTPASGGKALAAASTQGGKNKVPPVCAGMPALGGNVFLPALHGHAGAGVKRKAPATIEDEDLGAWRPNAYDDLQRVGNLYGMDLVSCPPEWLNEKNAREYLKCRAIRVPEHDGTCRDMDSDGQWGFWEIYSGVANATKAFLSPATGGGVAGPPVDKLPSPWSQLPTFDVFRVECRRLIWSLLIVFAPLWVHAGPPCTFWSTLSRRNNNRSYKEDERLRLESLVHIIFSVQVCQYQKSRRRYCSMEQPVRAASWKLDIVQDMLLGNAIAMMPAPGGMDAQPMKLFKFDSCCYAHKDPGNGRLYKKPQCFASNADMSRLCVKCCGGHVHQVVEGVVAGGPRHGVRRSVVAGEYPMDFCMAWARVIKSCRPLAA